MTAVLGDIRRRRPLTLALLVGLGGLVVAGAVGGVVGLLAGAVAARRVQVVLLGAALALIAAVAFTLFEAPLTEVRVFTFPEDRPLAGLAAKVSAVFLLAGLAGILERHGRDAAPKVPAREMDSALPHVPISTIAAVLAVSLLAAVVLWQIGDRQWKGVALAVAVTVLVLAGALALARSRHRFGESSP